MESTTFNSSEEANLVQYRQVSPSAILGLVTGILSSVALAHPFLWIVPVGGVLISTAALIGIKARKGEVTGSGMATWGLVLALFFGSWSMGQVMLRGYVLRGQARQFADHWLELWKQGELEQAHQLFMPAHAREPSGTDLKALYAGSEKMQVALNIFKGDTPRGWLRDLNAKGGTYRYDSTERHVQETSSEDMVSLLYDLSWEENGETVKRRIQVVVQRRVLPAVDVIDWQIREVDRPERVPL